MVRRNNWRTLVLLMAILSMSTAICGCSRDPDARKRKYLESAQQYFDQGQNREAVIQYMNALQLDQQYAEAHYGLAQVDLKMGAWNSAFLQLSRTLELQPNHLNARLDLGNLQLAARELKQAMQQAELVLAADPKNVSAYVLKANVHAASDEKQASIDAMQKAISLAPDRFDLYNNLGVLLRNTGRFIEAEASFRKAIELNPGSSMPVLSLAVFYQAQERPAEAEQQYERAIQIDPKDLSSRLALTRFYMLQNRRNKAEQITRETAALKDVPQAKTVLVDFYAGLGETDRALEAAALLYGSDGQDLAVKEAYVRTLLAKERFDEAERVNEEILKAESGNVNALIAKSQIYNNTGKPAEAIHLVERALKTEPDNAVGHYVLGVAASLTGDAVRAENEWREAVRLRPSLVEAQQALAAVAMQRGDLDLLATVSGALVSAQPASPHGYVLRALVAANRKEPAKAEADLQRAIRVAPANAVGYTKLGVWRFDQKKYGAAEKLFEQALAIDPNAAEALRGLTALNADVQKDLHKALSRVNAQIERAPSNSAYYWLLAMLQKRIPDTQAAEVSLQKAAELDPGNLDALLQLAQVQSATGRRDEAVKTYENVIRANPKNVNATVMLASLEQSRGNWQRAQALYQDALLVSPEYPPAANNLAYLLLERGGNLDLALSLAQTARRGMPDSTTAIDTLAWAYYQKGMYPPAVELLEECVRKAPRNPNYHYHLGLALQRQNDKLRARQHLERVLKIDPKYSEAQKVHQALSDLGA